jgi:hypothetical protein
LTNACSQSVGLWRIFIAVTSVLRG